MAAFERYPAPERVLLCGDLHGDLDWIDAAIYAAEQSGCGVVLQVGDLNWRPERAQGQELIEKVANSAPMWLLVDGNHDNLTDLAKAAAPYRPLVGGSDQDPNGLWGPTQPIELSDNIFWAARGSRWNWNGVAFGALGGAWSPGWWFRKRGVEWFPRELITRRDLEALGSEPLDVLVCHDGPGDVAPAVEMKRSRALRPFDGQIGEGNQRRIQTAAQRTRPQLFVHGHWHVRHSTTWHAPWGECRVEGLGSDLRPDAFAVLDLATLSVTQPVEVAVAV